MYNLVPYTTRFRSLAVDRIRAAAVAKERARDRHLAVVDRQRAIAVVERQLDLGTAEGRARRRAREDDVLHLPAAQRLGALLAHDPGEDRKSTRLNSSH